MGCHSPVAGSRWAMLGGGYPPDAGEVAPDHQTGRQRPGTIGVPGEGGVDDAVCAVHRRAVIQRAGFPSRTLRAGLNGAMQQGKKGQEHYQSRLHRGSPRARGGRPSGMGVAHGPSGAEPAFCGTVVTLPYARPPPSEHRAGAGRWWGRGSHPGAAGRRLGAGGRRGGGGQGARAPPHRGSRSVEDGQSLGPDGLAVDLEPDEVLRRRTFRPWRRARPSGSGAPAGNRPTSRRRTRRPARS